MKRSWLAGIMLVVFTLMVFGCGGAPAAPEPTAAPGPKTYEKMSLKSIGALQPEGKWVEVEGSFGQTGGQGGDLCSEYVTTWFVAPGKKFTDGGALNIFLVVPKSQYSLIENLNDGDGIVVKGYVTSEFCEGAGTRVPGYSYIWADSIEKVAAPEAAPAPAAEGAAAPAEGATAQ